MAPNRFYSSTAQEAQLTADITNVQTTIAVDGVSGFPASFPYTLGLEIGTAQQEIVTVTSAIGTNLTVTRGQDGTVAVSHNTGATVTHIHSARDFREPQEHLGESANVHGIGVGSDVVGTGTPQTLTEKDLTSGTNSFPATLATTTSGIVAKTADVKMTAKPVADSPAVIDNGWLKCDGGAVSRATFAALFAAIGEDYGAGNGTTTFNVPDFRGRAPFGAGTTMPRADDEGAAEADRGPGHTHAMGHTHGITNHGGHSHTLNTASNATLTGGGVHVTNASTNVGGAHDHGGDTQAASPADTGNGLGATNRMGALGINFLIKT